MARMVHYLIEGHSEHAHYPPHDGGKILSFPGPDNEVKVVSHYAEILDSKIIFRLRAPHDLQKQLFH